MLYILKNEVSGHKVNSPDGLWRPSWISVDYDNCPKLPSWQQR